MLKSVIRHISLTIRAHTGITVGFVVWMIVVALAVFAAFAFLCVAGYNWLWGHFGSVYAALIMAGILVVIAILGAAIAAMLRRRARARAILERAARAHAPSWLLDPKLLASALQIVRAMGWERIIPMALFGFLAAQWARERREQKNQDPE